MSIIKTDIRIEELYTQLNLPIEVSQILEYAEYLNLTEYSRRIPWVYKLLEADYSLGIFGHSLRFDEDKNTFSFFQLKKYDAIYRPFKYVYLPFGLSACPAAFSRDIAQNACAHVEECVKLHFRIKGVNMSPRATLGRMLRVENEFSPVLHQRIRSLNDIIYGRTKHQFKVDLPRKQLLFLAESIMVYFISRILGINVLQDCGILDDVYNQLGKSEKQGGIFIGMTWYYSSSELE